MGFLKSLGGVLKKVAPIASFIPGVGTVVGVAAGLAGAALSSDKIGGKDKPKVAPGGAVTAPVLTPEQQRAQDAVNGTVDQTAFAPSQQQTDLYNNVQQRLDTVGNRAAPTAEATQVAGGPVTATAGQAAPVTSYDAAQIDPNAIGLNQQQFSSGQTNTAKGGSAIDMGALQANQAQAGSAAAASAQAAVIDKTASDQVRAQQQQLIGKLTNESDGIASDALTRGLNQTVDRGVAAQNAMLNSARGNGALNSRAAANNAVKVAQQGANMGLDAFANERKDARNLLGTTMAQTRGVDADLAAQQAGFENATSMANAQNSTQASIANGGFQTQASLANSDNNLRALLANQANETDLSKFNASSLNQNNQFNANLGAQQAQSRDQILAQLGLANQSATNDQRSQLTNLNASNNQFNTSQGNALQQQLLGLNNSNSQMNAQLQQQTNLANQAAQLQQMGMNDAQISSMLGLQNNIGQNNSANQIALQQLLANNNNQKLTLAQQQNQANTARKDGILGKLGQGIATVGGAILSSKLKK